MSGPKDRDKDEDVEYYISADGRAFSNAADAIDASLQFESSSGTGAGCSQSPDYANNSDDSDGSEDSDQDDSDGSNDSDQNGSESSEDSDK
jgi:hypothetical protein